MKRLLIICTLVCAVGCSSDDNNGSTDAGHSHGDATHAHDQGGHSDVATPNNGTGGEDVGTVDDVGNATDTGTTAPDMASTDMSSADMSTAADVGSDMGTTTDPFAGRPVGQCTENADCPVGPQGQMCSRSLPGGACLGCGTDTDCPSDAICQFGTCIAECGGDDDCAPGLRCLGSGRCAALPCTDTCDISLFGCSDSGQCERIDCSGDPNICPANTTCTQGLCIEDRALN